MGLGLELNGQGVQVPAGYGSPGRVFVKAAAKFAAQSSLTFSHSQDSAYNQSKAEVERGVLAIALPREVTLNVGLAQDKKITRSTRNPPPKRKSSRHTLHVSTARLLERRQ